MVHYVMLCPIHTSNQMEHIKMVKRKSSAKAEPIFECIYCKKYYLYDAGTEGKIATYGGKDVFATHSKYKLYSDTFSKPSGGIWGGDSTKSPKNPAMKSPTPKYGLDITVRIKKVKDSEVTKARNNLSNIRNEYPSIATDKMSVNDFMLKVCGSNLERKCVVRNTSLNWKGTLVKKVEFYVQDSQYLKTRVPEGIYISFGGKLSNGEFVVDEIRVLNNPDVIGNWEQHTLKFSYDGPKNSNWFYDFLKDKGAAEPSKKLTGELASWNDYLDWKRQLAELRIKGIKYIAYSIDIDERKMTFLTVTEGMQQAKEFRKFLNRNEVSVFSNKYSKNRWSFEFNREYQDSQDSGIDVVFMEFGEQFQGERAVRDSSWKFVNSSAKKYKDEGIISFSDKMQGIGSNYFEPYFQEIVFELTERALSLIRKDIRRNGNVSESTEKSIEEEFFGDGFLATAQIGDFALLSRLQRAIDDLSSGKSAQQSLEKWLFDIKESEKPESIESIETWQNEKINEKQKRAVEKIISAPDVCLIQGPPGTGKTTVIAESIYQFVTRNKRVLVASQANLAVDNALERLISNPKIRAIRLGNAKKIDDSVKNITEECVLETFYESIVEYIQKDFLSKWEKIDLLEETTNKDFQSYQELYDQSHQIQSSIEEFNKEISALKEEQNSEEHLLWKNNLRAEKMSIVMIIAFCEDKTKTLELMLSSGRISSIWEMIDKKLQTLAQKGLYLTKVGIDVDDLNGPVKIEKANRIIKYVLLNINKALNLYAQLAAESQFGGESEELENLKLLEKDLREKMMSDPSVITEWQNVNLKIKELSQAGLGLSEDTLKLFGGIDSIPEKEQRAFLKNTLEGTVDLLTDIIVSIKELSEQLLNEIDSEILSFERLDEELDGQIIEKQNEVIKKVECLDTIQLRQNEILEQYDATDENLIDKISDYKTEKRKSLRTRVRRSEWEDIFLGLKTWVDEIPDYSQEKDIFLRDFINGCNVVGVSCTENTRTLTENGFDDFDVVIIDEVSKATPPELLIPMLRGRKIVLVGDHRQLPPLFNEHEKSYEEMAKQQEDSDDVIVQLTMEDFEKYKDMVTASLFERYFESADPSIKETLTYQYRMHSDIMDLINLFYDGLLRDGNEDEYTDDTKAHYLNILSTFGTEMIVPERHAYWFDSSQLAGERIFEYRKPQSSSCENRVEAETIIELLRKMENQYANMDTLKEPVSVGVISFYFDQVSLIRKMIKRESFHAIDVDINTVDRFQGKEKEIIFVSLVRNVKNPKHNIDSYIAAFQRINVAFSRAQNLLVILGATDMYAEQPVRITDMNNGEEKVIYPYRQILEIMNTRGTYFTCDEVIPEARVDEILMGIAKQGENEE